MDVRILQNGPAKRTDLDSSIDEAGALGLSADLPNGPDLVSRRPLTIRDYKTLALAALGGALEFYDFIIFIFFAQAIGQLFFPAEIPDCYGNFRPLASSPSAISYGR